MPMLKKLALFAIALVSVTLMNEASAALIDHGKYFTDSLSEKDWLKLGATAGRTYAAIESGWGGYVNAGWQMASPGDLAGLFVDAGAPNDGFPDIPKSEYRIAARTLIDLFGVTVSGQGDYGWSGGMTSLEASPGKHYMGIIQDNGNGTGYLVPSWRPQGDFNRIWGSGGAFLARRTITPVDLPEPSSILLVTLGATVLLVFLPQGYQHRC